MAWEVRTFYSLRKRGRSEEHTSELQSRSDLVCRLLLEKKKKKRNRHTLRFWSKNKREERFEHTSSSTRTIVYQSATHTNLAWCVRCQQYDGAVTLTTEE